MPKSILRNRSFRSLSDNLLGESYAVFEEYEKRYTSAGHKIGGYPYFTPGEHFFDLFSEAAVNPAGFAPPSTRG
jgi:hypothetical protein